MRFRCHISGCQLDREEYYNTECRRCRTIVHSEQFVQRGLLGRVIPHELLSRWSRLCRFVRSHCPNCSKRLWFSKQQFCSDKCLDEWIPF
jgi:hypothetical protein